MFSQIFSLVISKKQGSQFFVMWWPLVTSVQYAVENFVSSRFFYLLICYEHKDTVTSVCHIQFELKN